MAFAAPALGAISSLGSSIGPALAGTEAAVGPNLAAIAAKATNMPLSAFGGATIAGGSGAPSILGGLATKLSGGLSSLFGGSGDGSPVGGALGNALGGLVGGGSGKSSAPQLFPPLPLNNQVGPIVQPVTAQSVGNAGPLTGGTDLATLLRQILMRRGMA